MIFIHPSPPRFASVSPSGHAVSMRVPVIAIAVWVILSIAGAATAAAEPRRITLAAALAAADRAPARAADEARIAAADATVAATGGWSPTAVSVGTTINTTGVIAGASLPLPIFGREAAARQGARATARSARAVADAARLELREQVEVAWLELARSHARLVLSGDSAARAHELEGIAQARLDAGDVPAADVQAARAARIRADVESTTATADERAASATLASLLGWDPEVELVADGAEPTPSPPPGLAELRANLTRHPDARAAAAALEVARAGVVGARRERWPAIALDLEVDALDRRGDPDDLRATVVLELPLFGRTGAKVAAAQAEAAVAAAEGRARTQGLAGALVAAHRKATAAADRATLLARDVLPAQELAAAQAQQAYREGAADLTSALVAARELLAVRVEVVDAIHDAAVAHAALTHAIGGAP